MWIEDVTSLIRIVHHFMQVCHVSKKKKTSRQQIRFLVSERQSELNKVIFYKHISVNRLTISGNNAKRQSPVGRVRTIIVFTALYNILMQFMIRITFTLQLISNAALFTILYNYVRKWSAWRCSSSVAQTDATERPEVTPSKEYTRRRQLNYDDDQTSNDK